MTQAVKAFAASALWCLPSLLLYPCLTSNTVPWRDLHIDRSPCRASAHRCIHDQKRAPIASDAIQLHLAIQRQASLLSAWPQNCIRPRNILLGQARNILQEQLKDLLTADADLAIDACHSASALVDSVHLGIVKAKPLIEWLLPIEVLKLIQRQARTAPLPELWFVVKANRHAIEDCRQISIGCPLAYLDRPAIGSGGAGPPASRPGGPGNGRLRRR